MAVEGGQLGDELLITFDGGVHFEIAHGWTLAFHLTNSLGLVSAEGYSELVVEVERNDGLRKLVEVPAEDVCGIMDRVATPIQALTIALWGVEGFTKFLDALLRAAEPEDALDVGCWTILLVNSNIKTPGSENIPFSLRKMPHLATTIGT